MASSSFVSFVNVVGIKSLKPDFQTPASIGGLIKQKRRVVLVKAAAAESESGNEWAIKKTQMSDAQCEAAVVAGNAPPAPPAPPLPASPPGTPLVSPLVTLFLYPYS